MIYSRELILHKLLNGKGFDSSTAELVAELPRPVVTLRRAEFRKFFRSNQRDRIRARFDEAKKEEEEQMQQKQRRIVQLLTETSKVRQIGSDAH